jgi:hypothetical protein
MFVHHLGDAARIAPGTGRVWLPWHYLRSVPDLLTTGLA